MKATEFRIGNIVYVKGKVDELNGIADNDYYSTGYGHGVWDNDIEPIPLTEEWLLKFGFEKITHAVRSYSYHICDKNERYWFFRISGQFGTITREITCVLSYEIKHVHQLQNLYFALTGEELESTQTQKI
jgi:hypothetical protein